MWYEILPSAGIIFVAMCLPHYVSYAANKLLIDNMYRRSFRTKSLKRQYMRDRRLMDNPYKISGLEAIPDE